MPPTPESAQRVLAVIHPAAGDDLRAHCADALASCKCLKRLEFRADFPRTESGKLLRRRLRDAYENNER
ncbi:AMP-binding enzyme [Streptosporangium sp. NPDC002607]